MDVEAISLVAKPCYGAYYDIVDELTNYRRDLSVLDSVERRNDYRRQQTTLSFKTQMIRTVAPIDGCTKTLLDMMFSLAATDNSFDFYYCPANRLEPTCPDSIFVVAKCLFLGGAQYCEGVENLRFLSPERCGGDGLTLDTLPEPRLTEYQKRRDHYISYYKLENEQTPICINRWNQCNASTKCNLRGCETDYFLWACINPNSDFDTATVSYHYADTINNKNEVVTCTLPRTVMILRAEFGAGFQIQEASLQALVNCTDDAADSRCEFNARGAAALLNVLVQGQTFCVETLCAYVAGFNIFPDDNDQCIPCELGEYREEGMSACELVPLGHFSKTGQFCVWQGPFPLF